MMTPHKLDEFKGTVRFALGVGLLLIASEYGWTVVGIGALALAIVSFASAIASLWAFAPKRTATPARPSHLGHDVHDRAHEAHPWDTESL